MENQPRARRELLEWLRTEFRCSIDRIEECGSGAMYLQILDRLYPNRVPMNKVNWMGTTEYDMLRNFKLLQEIFKSLGITRGFTIDNLIKKKYPDNLELLQWFYCLFEKRAPEVPINYDPIARRKLSQYPLPPWALKTKSSAILHDATSHHVTTHFHPPRTRSVAPPAPPLASHSTFAARKEKDKVSFYESKLRAIAAVCMHTDDPEYVDKKVIEYILNLRETIEIDI